MGKKEKNEDLYFRWDREIVKTMTWADLPTSAKSAYPVIASHCDKNGFCFPSEARIAYLAGRNPKTIRGGIHSLADLLPGFRFETYAPRKHRISKKFFLTLPPIKEKGRWVKFNKSIVEDKIWQGLLPTAHALYMAIRAIGYFDMETFIEIEEDGDEYHESDFEEVFLERNFDYVSRPQGELADLAGISRYSVGSAVECLEENYLLEIIAKNLFKVYLEPFRKVRRRRKRC